MKLLMTTPEPVFCFEVRRSKIRTGSFSILVIIAGLQLILFSGCQSNKPAAARFASVEISGNTPGQINLMAIAVFKENGYSVAHADPNRLILEKESSTVNNIAYGNWEGKHLWTRVKASIVPVTEGVYRLQCHAYHVRDKGEPTFEEEIKVQNFSSHGYQKMLEAVARRLKREKPE